MRDAPGASAATRRAGPAGRRRAGLPPRQPRPAAAQQPQPAARRGVRRAARLPRRPRQRALRRGRPRRLRAGAQRRHPRPRRAARGGEPAAGPLRGADPARPAAPTADLAELAARLPVVVVARRGPRTARSTSCAPTTRPASARPSTTSSGSATAASRTSTAAARPGAAERRRGYRDAMQRHGLDADAAILPGGLTEDDGAAAARALLDARPAPTAVTVFNDRCATGVLDVLRRAGVAVPGDVSVVGLRRQPAGPPVARRPDHRRPGHRADHHARRRPRRRPARRRRRRATGAGRPAPPGRPRHDRTAHPLDSEVTLPLSPIHAGWSFRQAMSRDGDRVAHRSA